MGALSPKQELLLLLQERDRRVKSRKLFTYFPEEGPLRRELYAKHMEFFAAGADFRERCFMAANRIGKALKHGTRVATPNGWRVIEELAIGDAVMAGDGSTTHVVGVYPQGEVDLFALSFDGRYEVVTCGAHLWKYQHPRARFPYRQSHGFREANPFFGEWSVGSTEELRKFGSGPRTRAAVPMTQPFALHGATLPLDPYILGVLLGDGGLSGESIKLSSADNEILDAVRAVFKVSHYEGCDYGVVGAVPVIRALGLLGTTSHTKFVPTAYLFADAQTRLAVLQGLMDTDGSIHGAGAAMEYSTCSDRLADDFEWLAVSLGMKVRRERRHTKAQNGNGSPSWRIALRSPSICPFLLSRKVARWRPLKETGNWLLHGIAPAGRGLATCIEVAHESHTFTIEHGIVTHNTEGAGGYETALHLTGRYPDWWEGRRFDAPVNWWMAGKTNETTRDILQKKMLGAITYEGGRKSVSGTGLIPGDDILGMTWKQGVADLLDTVKIQHVSGGVSILGLKSYQQGRGSFEGTEQHGIWLDEEPPADIYGECVIRTATTQGIIIITFTPLDGLSDVVMSFLPKEYRLDA